MKSGHFKQEELRARGFSFVWLSSDHAIVREETQCLDKVSIFLCTSLLFAIHWMEIPDFVYGVLCPHYGQILARNKQGYCFLFRSHLDQEERFHSLQQHQLPNSIWHTPYAKGEDVEQLVYPYSRIVLYVFMQTHYITYEVQTKAAYW